MDLNGDGHLDILSGSYSAREIKGMAGLFQVLWGSEKGFEKEVTPLKGSDGKPLLIGDPSNDDTMTDRICTRPTAVDWDSDGDLDLLVGNFKGSLFLFRGEGGGKFAPQSEDLKLAIEGYHSDPFCVDLDGDGHGDSSGEQLPSVVSCEAPAGYVVLSGDCDDGRAFVYPGAGEVCNGLDDDCNGAVDDAATGLRDWYVDGDTDGFGTGVPLSACLAPPGRVAADGDCDDTDDRYHPSALEPICQQPFDFNCDGFTGAGDADGDGFSACEECDDGAAGTNPSAPEVCDNVDNDCDGAIDEEPSNGQTYFQDQDGDGQGSAAVTLASGSFRACDPF